MTMSKRETRYLQQAGTGRIYVETEHLLMRNDMRPYHGPQPGQEPEEDSEEDSPPEEPLELMQTPAAEIRGVGLVESADSPNAEQAPPELGQTLEAMTKADLVKLAESMGLPLDSRLTKDAMLAAIHDAQGQKA